MEKMLFTAIEAAQVLNISKRKVYEMMAAGEIDSVKIGGCRRIPRVALDRFLESLMGSNTAA